MYDHPSYRIMIILILLYAFVNWINFNYISANWGVLQLKSKNFSWSCTVHFIKIPLISYSDYNCLIRKMSSVAKPNICNGNKNKLTNVNVNPNNENSCVYLCFQSLHILQPYRMSGWQHCLLLSKSNNYRRVSIFCYIMDYPPPLPGNYLSWHIVLDCLCLM